jgi:ubiquinone/menaquinone biosynthesis C-methylase UbiE
MKRVLYALSLRQALIMTGNSLKPEPMEILSTHEGYRRWAEFYDGEDNPLILLEQQHLPGLVGDVAGLEVIDIGCGTGRQALRLAAAGARVTGIDFSEAMLEKARAKPGAEAIRFQCHDLAQRLPFADASFARVFCCLVLDHIRDLDLIFSEFRRLCAPSGLVVISVMHPAMLLKGVQARFIDPQSGRRISPLSYSHQTCNYLMAGIGAKLRLSYIGEYCVDSGLVARSPRAGRYLGWPMLLLMTWRPA